MINSCMAKYRSQFMLRFASHMQKDLKEWERIQKEHRYTLVTTWMIGYGLAFVAGFLPGKHERNYFENLEMHFWIGVVLLITTIIMAIGIENKSYQDEIKNKLFQDLLKVFSENIRYSKKSLTGNSVDKIQNYVYEQSLIMKRFKDPKRNLITYKECDDCFWGNYNDVDFSISEVDISNTIYDKKSGKAKSSDTLFKGLALYFKLHKSLKNRVLIYSKSVFNDVPQGYEKVLTEYDKFDNKYDVWVDATDKTSTAQVEARYLLNASFLDSFMQLHTTFHVTNLKCSVYGSDMLILLKTRKDLFELNHLFGNISDVNQYKKLFDEFASVLSFIDILKLSSNTKL